MCACGIYCTLGPQDYLGIDEMVEFTNEDTTPCINVIVKDDVILENDEQFTVNASSLDPSVQLPSTPVVVTIQDDDSK